jgi:serine/threonine-protein kinase RsbW
MSKVTATLPRTRVFSGSKQQIRNVREFVGRVVGGTDVADDVVLLSSELATNAIVHSASGGDGTFTVLVLAEGGLVRVEVHDQGSAEMPAIRESRQPAESGAGLNLVDYIADRWGFYGGPSGRVVWFEMDVARI